MRSGRFIFSFISGFFAAAFIWLISLPSYKPVYATGDNYYAITLNGVSIGALSDPDDIRSCLREARKNIAGDGDRLVLADSDLDIESSYVTLGRISEREEIVEKMTAVLQEGYRSTLSRSYTVKINEFAVNLSSMQDVQELIYAAKSKYDEEDDYEVRVSPDSLREINVMTAQIVPKETESAAAEEEVHVRAGGSRMTADLLREAEPDPQELEFFAFQLGLTDLGLGDKVEIVESYLPPEEITDVTTAINTVTKENETNKVYEVVAGDTLGGIAQQFDLTLDELIAMNENLTSEKSMIRPQDNLIVTVPEPLLSVTYTMEQYIEEDFNLPIEYIDNPDWYTTMQVTRREPVTGHRRIIARISYSDGSETGREIIKEEVTKAAVAQIIERGTKTPPTYIKPISGGYLSSRFGYRVLRGRAGTHTGVDWACPTGTTIFASSGGTVTHAGWMGSYGYCVFINHPDGTQTRYAHMSRILCSVGSYVSQMQAIGLSGNTGNSTGPHVHFEIRMGGQAVNPLNYLQ